MNLSFAGCGFLGIYHVGVAVCFRKYAPHLLLDKISGASFGAISACCLLCDLPLGELTNDVLRAVSEVRAGSLGPFSPSFNVQNILLEGLEKFLPDDAHIRVSGKLHISLTRVYDGKNVITSQFNSKDDLLQALMASCFIPVFSGLLPPRFHGIRYMDGGFSDNLPVLDENTITVSPFCGESDICPRDLSSQLFHVNVANTSIELSKQNINRFVRILFPPKPEVLSNMCKQGFDDALRFLHRNNLISCTRCLAVQSTFQIQETLDDTLDYDPECLECKSHRQEALVANLPDTVMTVFQNAIDSANKGLINWMMRHKSIKLLSLMTIPYRVPIDIVYATITKVMRNSPSMSRALRSLGSTALEQLYHLLYSSEQPDSPLRPHMPAYGSLSDSSYSDIENDSSPLKALQKASIMAMGVENSYPPFSGSEDDTFEQILKVTSQQEALMAYYYMDENNKMKLTEIFDVTDAEGEGVQSPTERDANIRLEFDEDWGGEICDDNEFEGESDISIEDSIIDKNIFSDPESEWSRERPSSPPTNQEIEEDLSRPESDQPPRKYTPKPDNYRITLDDS